MDDARLMIDGQEITAAGGTSVLEAALGAGIYIPHLCHHPDLKPVGVCRLCMVEIAGKGLTLSCLAAVEEGMVVRHRKPGNQQSAARRRRIARLSTIAANA